MTTHNFIERRWNGRTKNLKALGLSKWEAHRAILTAMINVLTDEQIRKLGRGQNSVIEKVGNMAYEELNIRETTTEILKPGLTDVEGSEQSRDWGARILRDREHYFQLVAAAEDALREIQFSK